MMDLLVQNINQLNITITNLSISLNGQIEAIQVDISALKQNDRQLSQTQNHLNALKSDFSVLNFTIQDNIDVLNEEMDNMKNYFSKLLTDEMVAKNCIPTP